MPDPRPRSLAAAGRRAGIVASAVALARDLVNTPPNDLPPAEFARRAEEAGLAAGLEVEVLDEDALTAAGFGGVLGVGGGSQRPPRLVRIRHAGTGPQGRAGRQGHHVRLRRHLDQAGRRAWTR